MKEINLNILSFKAGLRILSLGIITATTLNIPTLAAEKIVFIYGPINRSLRISSLETFVQEGIINRELNSYLNIANVTPEERVEFRKLLTKKIEVNPVTVSRLLNTDEGARLLSYFGNIINIQGGRNGIYALRSAIVSSALSPEGLTLINVLKKFPTNIQIDIVKTISIAQKGDVLIIGTKLFTEEIIKLSTQEIAKAKYVDFSQLGDLSKQGNQGYIQKRLTFIDPNRNNRKFDVEIYQPQRWREGKTPVIIMSHGLGSNPKNFANQAQYLASYGYFVVIPEHIGSNDRQTQDFLKGFSNQLFLLNEFIDRPKDISFTIDELEKRNQTEFAGKLELNKVAAFGHSFGGYAVLATAGATIDFNNLQENCELDLGIFNTSLLLQCRALQLEQKDYNFKDDRIAVVYAMNPVNASIFGPQGLGKIPIPVFIVAGNYDPLTPFIFEQVTSFSDLTTKNKYLQLQEGQAHVNVTNIDWGISELIQTIPELSLPEQALLYEYTNSVLLAFLEVHLLSNAEYEPYLQSSYLDYLSQNQEFKTYLITADSDASLKLKIKEYIQRYLGAKYFNLYINRRNSLANPKSE